MPTVLTPRRAPIVVLIGGLSLAVAGCATDDAGRLALAETTTLRSQMDQTRERQESQARDIAKIQSELRGIESDTAERTREIRAAGAELARSRVLLEEARAALREQQAATAAGTVGSSSPSAGTAYTASPPPAPTTPSAPPMPIAPLPEPSAPEARATASRVPVPAAPAPRAAVPPAPDTRATPDAKPVPAAKPAPAAKVVAAAKPAAAPAAQPKPVPKPASAEQIFSTAMANLRAQEHGQAVLELSDLIARFPTHSLAPAAQLWIGEAYYQQRDYRQSLVELKRVGEGYPKSPQVADALLKTGLCHRALGDRSSAGAAWEQVVRDYPTSAAAGQARSLLGSRESAARSTR